MSNQDFLIGGASAAALILIVVQLFKMYGMPSKFAPLLSILLGVGFGVLSELEQPDIGPPIARWTAATIRGFLVGASASGIYAMISFSQQKVDERLTEEAIERGDVVEAEVVSRPAETSLIPSTNTLSEGDTALRVSDANTPAQPVTIEPEPIGGTPTRARL